MPSPDHVGKGTLHHLANLPAFGSEAEEAAFWDHHELGKEVLEQMAPLPDDVLPERRSADVTVTVRQRQRGRREVRHGNE